MNFEKYVRLTTGFQNAKYAIGFNGLQVCPSVPLNLVAVPTVENLVNLVLKHSYFISKGKLYLVKSK